MSRTLEERNAEGESVICKFKVLTMSDTLV